MIRIGAFVLLSLLILWVSRRSLRYPKSHGFARFFAFEAILALIVLNAPRWFTNPIGKVQLFSWLLLTLSLVFVLWGFLLLRHRGDFKPPVEESSTFAWENTGRLVTTGIFRYIRHPMYSSLLFLAWGAVLKSVTSETILLGLLATLTLFATARHEEAENVRRFGQPYLDYMERTRRFVPFLL